MLAGFVSVCGAEIALGALILQGAPSARAASHALVPFELAFWLGFALPFGLVLGLMRVLMLAPRTRR